MADVITIPRIRCDNCGRIEDKERRFEKYEKPRGWGSVRIDCLAGTYPPHITMTDICPSCFKAVYEAAGKALDKARSEGPARQGAGE